MIAFLALAPASRAAAPALLAASLVAAAAAFAFFSTVSLAALAAALASALTSRGDAADAPALGVVAAEGPAGVDERDAVRGVNDFLRDSLNFLRDGFFSMSMGGTSVDEVAMVE